MNLLEGHAIHFTAVVPARLLYSMWHPDRVLSQKSNWKQSYLTMTKIRMFGKYLTWNIQPMMKTHLQSIIHYVFPVLIVFICQSFTRVRVGNLYQAEPRWATSNKDGGSLLRISCKSGSCTHIWRGIKNRGKKRRGIGKRVKQRAYIRSF